MKYLADTNVLSETVKPSPSPRVARWWSQHDSQTVTNPIVLGELEFGILRLPAGRRRARLRDWFDAGVKAIPVLKIDGQTAQIWAEMLDKMERLGRKIPVKDSLIAASALQFGLTIATRNISHFSLVGVPVVNPFDA